MGKKNLVVDAIALIVYVICANPVVTGIGLHEWLGLGVLVVLFVHVAFHLGWVLKTLVEKRESARLGHLALDVVLLIVLLVCIVSGIMISATVLPTLGYVADGYYLWDATHAFAAKLLLALLLVHVALHGAALRSLASRREE